MIKKKVNYETMLVIFPQFNEYGIKKIATNYAQQLLYLGASEIVVLSRGNRSLSYTFNKNKIKTACFIELRFSCFPETLNFFRAKLELDNNVMRHVTIRN